MIQHDVDDLLQRAMATGGRELSADERRNVATACEQMDAAMAGWRDAAEGRRRLEAIQDENLVWFTPSSNPHTEMKQGREEYIKLVTEFQFDHYIPGSKVEIFDVTAEGNRVATEMISDIVMKDGTPYTNRYQQLFEFNSQGKVAVYKLYMDTAIFIRDDNKATKKIADDFLYALSTCGTLGLRYLMKDDATWSFPARGGDIVTLNKSEALDRIERLQSNMTGLGFDEVYRSPIIRGNYVTVRATVSGTDIRDGKPFSATHHFVIKTEKPQEASHAGRVIGGKITEIREYVRGGFLPEV